MRLIGFVVAALALSGSAVAQVATDWVEFSAPDMAFTVSFPIVPQAESTTYQVAPGRSVPAQVYTARTTNGIFAVTVADLANTGLQENAVIDFAVNKMSQGGEVKVNFPHRIYQVYGRQMSVAGKDGSHSTIAMFDTNGKLYQVEAKVLPRGNDVDLIRFQQSLIFDRKLSNRSQDTINAIKQACSTSPNRPNNPAGLDDPRCQQK
jgi:hypothetical protein